MQIIPLTLEEFMRANPERDVEIAAGSAEAACVALALVANARAVFHARRDAHGDFVLVLDASIAAAGMTRIANDGSGAAAGAAGAGDREKSLLVADLPASLAVWTSRGSASGGRTGAAAALADLHAANRDLRLLAEDRFFEFDGEVVADRATLLDARGTAAAADVEHFAEQIPEDGRDVLGAERIAIEARCAEAGVAVTIVGGALLRVAQHLIGLAACLESLLRFGIAGIAIGMMLQGQLAIRGFQLLIGRRAGNAKDFVVIGFNHVIGSAHASFCCELLATRTSAGRSRRSRIR